MIFNLEPLRKNFHDEQIVAISFHRHYAEILNCLMYAHVYAVEQNCAKKQNDIELELIYTECEAKALLRLMTHCATRLNVLPLPKGRLNELQDEIIALHDKYGLLFQKEKRNV